MGTAAPSRASDGPNTPAAVQRTAEPAPPDGPAVTVRGQVVTPDGRPIGGAAVVLRAKIGGSFYASGLPHNRDVLARTTADKDGRFAFDHIAIPPRLENIITGLMRGDGGVEVLARAKGRALAWAEVKRLTENEPVRLTLAPEVAVTGVVRDQTGRGLSEALVSVFGLTRATTELDGMFRQPGDLNLTLSEFRIEAIADADGRFTLQNLPAEHRIGAVVDVPGASRKAMFIDTGTDADLAVTRERGPYSSIAVLRSPLTVTPEPQRYVRVKVVDADGRAVPDGGFEVSDDQRRSAGRGALNERGEAFIAIRAPGKFRFHYGSDPLRPRLNATIIADIPAGDDSPTIEFRLPAHGWVTGRVVDADTGKGIVGVYVSYGRRVDAAGDETPASSIGVSGADGSFRLPAVVGRGSVNVIRSVYGYVVPYFATLGAREQNLSGVPVEVPATGDAAPVTVSLGRGLVVRGTVIGADGKPAAGAVVNAENEEPRLSRRVSAIADAQGHFALGGLYPTAKASLTVSAAGGATRLTLEATPDHPLDRTLRKDLDVRLKPAIALTGRVLFNGQPRAGVVMRLHRGTEQGGGRLRMSTVGESTTDVEGRYRIDGLEPGDRYAFEVVDKEGLVDPDWRHQSPYVQTVRAQAGEVSLPDVNLATRGQALRGVVVDPQGKPVAGVNVSASLVGGRSLSRPRSGPPPWATTDAEGRFDLRQLPDQPIELMVYKPGPGGTRIRYPAHARPALNDRAIRIVFDPSLGEEIEDLDKPKRPDTPKRPGSEPPP
jgi:hypothetical protein